MTEEPWIKKIREQLEKHSEAVPASEWERLEQELQPAGSLNATGAKKAPAKRYAFLYRQWPAAAAAVILLVLVGSGIWLTNHTTDDIRMAVLEHPASPNNLTGEKQPEESTDRQTPLLSLHDAPDGEAKGMQTTMYTDAGREVRRQEEPEGQEEAGGQQEEGKSQQEEDNRRQKEGKGTDASLPDEQSEEVSETNRREETDNREYRMQAGRSVRNATAGNPGQRVEQARRKKRGNWSMALAAGNAMTGNQPGYEANRMASSSSPLLSDMLFGLSNGSSVIENMPAPPKSDRKEVIDARHRLPLSFGLSVRRSIGRHWSLETGVTYTYLASELSSANTPEETMQRLHYIGIPLRASYELVRKAPFSLYVSAGGSVEKCIHATRDTEHITVKPLQFSVTGAIGAQYDLGKHIGLYVEPGISHYFNDHSDVQTYRKENPTEFTLQGGIRIQY